MHTREEEILFELVAAGAVERAFSPDPLTDQLAEGMHMALMLLNASRQSLGIHPDQDPYARGSWRQVLREVGATSSAGLTAIDSRLTSPRFGTIEEIARRASAGVRKALDKGEMPLPVERFSLEEAWEMSVFLLTAAFPPYCSGLQGSEHHLEQAQNGLLDALVVAVLGVRLIEGE